ncbi:MDR family MFS transporter [Actinokineospora pegani]|uniref:MDR family MFS transporter n=1 Tax=Actinokineospora pegani TaxID=2654637 RepID=UPI0012EAE76A|nr:MDR family MFS transporter [Actinokineospora pegani]
MSDTTTGPTTPAPRQLTNRREVLQAISGLMLGMFVAVLAGTIVANALPRIINDLNGSQSVYTWVITTELLAMTATVPLWGKMADLYSRKLLIQASLGMFALGSLLAGISPNIEFLIVSRIAQGIGAGGITALATIVMAAIIPPRELGRYAGIFGAVFGVGTVAGPLIGGVIVDTSWLGWRWCFLIGVPFTLASIILLQKTLNLPTIRKQVTIDWLGAALIVTGVSTLLIWSSLAGNTFDWASGWTAALVTAGIALLALAILVESRAADPVVPLSIFGNRTVAMAVIASAFVGTAMFGGTVFLSQFFQIGHGMSPTEAGLLSLPLVFGLLISSTVAGQLISKHGKWKTYLVSGGVITVAGMALLATISTDTSLVLIGVYMALFGIGIGLLMQNLVLVAQNDVPAKDLGATTSTITFFRSLGGAIGVSALGAVLANRISSDLAERIPGTPTTGGSTEVPDLSVLPDPIRLIVQDVYSTATAHLFLIATPIAAVALIAVLLIKEKPLKTQSGDERLAAELAASGH